MRLLIISNMSHYQRDGQIVGWGPVVQEIDHLTQVFPEIRHIACLYAEPAPLSALPYASEQVHLIPVPPAGGDGFRDKIGILRLIPLYLRTMLKELRQADVVHVRTPANISLLAIVLLALVRAPRRRWVKFAGNWCPNGQEPRSSTFQRWWLNKGLHRGVVTVNGQWPGQPGHVHSFLNPCLTEQEINEAHAAASAKQLSAPLRLLYGGRLAKVKGVDRALHILARLQQRGISATLDLAGDGPERAEFEKLAADLGISHLVKFHGWLPRWALGPLYSQAHIMVFPSDAEGWPKVLSEAMAYGVVPVASNVGSIAQYLERFGTGRTFEPDDVEGFSRAIAWYHEQREAWKEESENGLRAVRLFSYTNYLQAVRAILGIKADAEADGEVDSISK